jgi:hypothetical protein
MMAAIGRFNFVNLSSGPHLYQLIGPLRESDADDDFVRVDENVYSIFRRFGTHGAAAEAASVTWAT